MAPYDARPTRDGEAIHTATEGGDVRRRKNPVLILLAVAGLLSCHPSPGDKSGDERLISREAAIDIATQDARRVFVNPGELDVYVPAASLTEEGWRVDFEFRDRGLTGGGPHYLIDGHSGRILRRRFEQ